jgi:hypothetical protein
MFMVPIKLVIVFCGVMVLSACAVVHDERRHIQTVGAFGMEAYLAGDYPLAEDFLKKAIAAEYEKVAFAPEDEPWHTDGSYDARGKTEVWRNALAHVYWETGRDYVLLDFAEQYLGSENKQYWWCRILERRGHPTYAESCWIGVGGNIQAKRVIRTELLRDAFAPDGSVFGRRSPPYADD